MDYVRRTSKLGWKESRILPASLEKTKGWTAGVGIGEKYTEIDISVKNKKGTETFTVKARFKETDPKKPWILHSLGNGSHMSDIAILDECDSLSKKLDANIIVFDYPGVNDSGGTVTKENLIDAYEAVLKYLEEEKKAKEIIAYGHSLGGAIQGAAFSEHVINDKIKYVLIKDRTFSKVTSFIQYKAAAPLSGTLGRIPVLGSILKMPAHLITGIFSTLAWGIGWEIDVEKSSRALSEKTNVHEIILQHTGTRSLTGRVSHYEKTLHLKDNPPTRISTWFSRNLRPLLNINWWNKKLIEENWQITDNSTTIRAQLQDDNSQINTKESSTSSLPEISGYPIPEKKKGKADNSKESSDQITIQSDGIISKKASLAYSLLRSPQDLHRKTIILTGLQHNTPLEGIDIPRLHLGDYGEDSSGVMERLVKEVENAMTDMRKLNSD